MLVFEFQPLILYKTITFKRETWKVYSVKIKLTFTHELFSNLSIFLCLEGWRPMGYHLILMTRACLFLCARFI